MTIHTCKNIIGYLPASQATDSCIILSAHYDHLGEKYGYLFPGANDNASGVAVMMETARYLTEMATKGRQMKYNIVFIAFSAEEYGMLGSDYFTRHSPVDLSKVKYMVNLDMVGGIGSELKDHPDQLFMLRSNNVDPNLIHTFHDLADRTDGIDFNDSGKDKYLKYSDQAKFEELGVPSVFFFSGEDSYYHKPTDTKEHLNFEKMEGLTQVLVQWLVAM